MFLLKEYQTTAVDELKAKFFKLIDRPQARHNLVFKAPTGAGKTVMMADFLNKVAVELPDQLEIKDRNVAYVWIAPNKLYIQSYQSIKRYFEETRVIKPVYFEDITGNCLQPNEVLFVNWESINKENNVMVRDSENNKNLYSYINQAKLNDTKIVVIIDEEHFFSGVQAKKAQKVLQELYPKVEIRVSATPITNSDFNVFVDREDVIKEGMIKEQIILNPTLDEKQEGRSVEEVLLDQALEKRKELKAAYEKLGIDINPLLLIQLPNDKSDKLSVDDQNYIELVKAKLEHSYGITTANNKLAIWLSNEKENLTDIEKPNNITEVLLFKQAIALGWDCPRAAVLLIFRELGSNSFTTQTVGRILRMPEQLHYPDYALNQGYVFTNISRNQIEIVRDDINYITMNRARRIENYHSINLTSNYINTRVHRNRLGSKFRKSLYEVAQDLWGITRDLGDLNYYEKNIAILKNKHLETNVEDIHIILPQDIYISEEVQKIDVETDVVYAQTPYQLNLLFRQFCRENVGDFAPVDSTPVLELALKMFFEDYFGLPELNAIKIILFERNNKAFIEMIYKSLEVYQNELEEKAKLTEKDVQSYEWEVPIERIYNENFIQSDIDKHVLEPYYQYQKASTPEKTFELFLDDHQDFIEWWYKNGDKGKEHFAVKYTKESHPELFYVDYVIQMKNGILCLFDTKTKDSDSDAPLKHNALIEFIENLQESGKKVIGGILINESKLWKYPVNRIDNTRDLFGWETFNPNNYK